MTPASQTLEGSTAADVIVDRFCSRYGSATLDEALIAACRAFTSAHGADSLPLRLDVLLRAVRARREVRRLTGDGRLEMDGDGQFVVVVDAMQHWSRQRFTVAHELAHIVLFSEFAGDPEALRNLRRPELWSAVERACNAAAAELLMPADDLGVAVEQTGLEPRGLSELHERYAVSWSALLVRLSEVFRVSVAVFRRHARHSSEPERWRVHRFYGAAHGVWLPTGMTTRHLSVPIVEHAAADGFAEAKLVVDAPTLTNLHASATSLVHARGIRPQQGLFEELPAEEPARWPEVAVFLVSGEGPDRLSSLLRRPLAVDAARRPGSNVADDDFRTLTLW